MYLFLTIAIPILLILVILTHFRKKRNIRKVCALGMSDKCKLLDELMEPFGYCYVPSEDVFSTRLDAWQRQMGYCKLYDDSAYHLHMIFDSLPVYFDYRGRTWLLEFWKGQYGINTGAEIGLYYADRILEDNELGQTLFQAVEDGDMVKMSFSLFKNDERISYLTGRHWWLTVFHVGCFSRPQELSMRASVTFPDREMAESFVRGLARAGYSHSDICRQCNTVTLSFVTFESKKKRLLRNLRIRLAMWSNRFWCRVYLFITRPFRLSADRILYLYYYLPFAFRRTLRIRRFRKRKSGKHTSSRQGGVL